MKTEAEITVTLPQAKKHQGRTDLTRRWKRAGWFLPYTLEKEHGLANFLVLDC